MTKSAIDRSVFAELQDAMGADFVEELVSTFLDEAPGILADLKSAAEMGAQDAFRRAAHSLKSNANIFGAYELAELARGIEASDLKPGSKQNGTQITALSAEYERAATTLKDLLDE